jgi:hypothetical protein
MVIFQTIKLGGVKIVQQIVNLVCLIKLMDALTVSLISICWMVNARITVLR